MIFHFKQVHLRSDFADVSTVATVESCLAWCATCAILREEVINNKKKHVIGVRARLFFFTRIRYNIEQKFGHSDAFVPPYYGYYGYSAQSVCHGEVSTSASTVDAS